MLRMKGVLSASEVIGSTHEAVAYARSSALGLLDHEGFHESFAKPAIPVKDFFL